MRAAVPLLALALVYPAAAAAHGVHAPPGSLPSSAKRSWLSFDWIGSARATARIRLEESGGVRIIEADGLPDHATGTFPNRRNPNSIREQKYDFRVPLRPQKAGRITPLVRSPFGIALNGVLFDPGTAEFWNDDPASGWNYEALSGKVDLGLDASNAHVQPNGAYHYHGLPTALLERLRHRERPALLGYAADGFPIYGPFASDKPGGPLRELRSGYRVKAGMRAGGPGGSFDGTFVEDYEYVAGAGDLDACNGREGPTPEYPDGTYYYVVAAAFPFIPRCYVGTPDASFQRRGGGKPPPPKKGFKGPKPPPF